MMNGARSSVRRLGAAFAGLALMLAGAQTGEHDARRRNERKNDDNDAEHARPTDTDEESTENGQADCRGDDVADGAQRGRRRAAHPRTARWWSARLSGSGPSSAAATMSSRRIPHFPSI